PHRRDGLQRRPLRRRDHRRTPHTEVQGVRREHVALERRGAPSGRRAFVSLAAFALAVSDYADVPSHGKSEIREKRARFAEWSPWGRRIWVCDRPTCTERAANTAQ